MHQNSYLDFSTAVVISLQISPHRKYPQRKPIHISWGGTKRSQEQPPSDFFKYLYNYIYFKKIENIFILKIIILTPCKKEIIFYSQNKSMWDSTHTLSKGPFGKSRNSFGKVVILEE
jgi:hypothetical protein